MFFNKKVMYIAIFTNFALENITNTKILKKYENP